MTDQEPLGTIWHCRDVIDPLPGFVSLPVAPGIGRPPNSGPGPFIVGAKHATRRCIRRSAQKASVPSGSPPQPDPRLP